MLTITGGQVVNTAAEYEGIVTPLPPSALPWSPVAHYGGYHQPAEPATWSGALQARTTGGTAADSAEQHQWRTARGPAAESALGGDATTPAPHGDPRAIVKTLWIKIA